MTAAIDVLPDDILLTIFLSETPRWSEYPYSHRGTLCVPKSVDRGYNVRVSHICRRWRSLALNASPMWSSVYIHGSRWFKRQHVDRFVEYVARSGNAKLEIFIGQPPIPIPSSFLSDQAESGRIDRRAALTRLLDAIIPRSIQWIMLSLWMWDVWSITCTLPRLSMGVEAPNLRHVRFTYGSPIEPEPNWFKFSTSYLKILDLLRCRMLSGGRLTTLDIDFGGKPPITRAPDIRDLNVFISFLRISQCLETLRLRCNFQTGEDIESEAVISLPNLRELAINLTNRAHEQLFSRLQIPQLRKLTLYSIGVQALENPDLAVTFSQIEHLHYSIDLHSEQSEFRKTCMLFTKTLNLTTLDLFDSFHYPLQVLLAKPELLPQLVNIGVDASWAPELSPCLRARSQAGLPIMHLRLARLDDVRSELDSDLEDACAQVKASSGLVEYVY